MKKILLILSFASFFNSFGQSIEIDFNQDAIKKLKEEPVLFLNNFEDQKLIGFICQGVERPIEARLLVKVYSEKGLWKQATSESFKIFPGNIFFPGNISFPGNIFEKLPKGRGLILFDIELTSTEQLFLLRKLPSRIPIVYNN